MSAVNCTEVRDSFRRGERPAGAAVEQHVAECAACRELSTSDVLGPLLATSGVRAPAVDPRLEAEIAAVLLSERGPRAALRALPSWLRVALTACGALALALGQFLLRPSPGTARAIPALATLSLIAFAVLLSSARAVRDWQKAAVCWLGAGLPGFLALGLFASEPPRESYAHAFACFGYGTVFALPLLGLLTLLERRERLPPLDAALLGASSGLIGAIVLDLHCADTHPAHQFLGHVSVVWAFIVSAWAWTLLRRVTASHIARPGSRSRASS
jgi:hypothetical protein